MKFDRLKFDRKIELLAPAGDMEKLRFAITYGADAVYFGGKIGSLRSGADNLSTPEIYKAVEYVHDNGKKAYLALNIYAHEEDIRPLETFIKEVKGAEVDAFIVSDPGVLSMIKDIIPDATLHLSTQASATNALAAKFWEKAGVSRVIAAREMTLAEIRHLTATAPEIEVEVFVHGAMCVSYSGRCLLSAAMTGRDANKGECAHPCRYRYVITEEKRPGEFYALEEDSRGTYIMNSKDLCMINHVPKLVESGIVSLKIEGRMKSLYYVSIVVKAYRQALDAYYAELRGAAVDFSDSKFSSDVWQRELETVSHRPYSTGFYFGKPGADSIAADVGGYASMYDFVGIVKSFDSVRNTAVIEQRNKIFSGDLIEFIGPETEAFPQIIEAMYDAAGDPIDSAPHAQQIIQIPMSRPVSENYILRRQKQLTDV